MSPLFYLGVRFGIVILLLLPALISLILPKHTKQTVAEIQ